MAGKGGGAWKVAYADFVTAMMAFFMVMWLTSQKQDVREAVAEHFGSPSTPLRGSKRPFAPYNAYKAPKTDVALDTNLPPAVSDTNPDGDPTRRPRTLTLHQDQRPIVGGVVNFALGATELDATAQRQLRQIVRDLAGLPQKIEIRGHSGGEPLPPGSPFADHWQLSYARATAVLRFLETLGIRNERVRLSQAGAHEPLTLAADADKQRRNARVEVYLMQERAEDLVGTPQERAERTAGH